MCFTLFSKSKVMMDMGWECWMRYHKQKTRYIEKWALIKKVWIMNQDAIVGPTWFDQQ